MELSEVEVAHRSRLSTFIKTCRSERKAGENQQVVTASDQLLAPSSSRFMESIAACDGHKARSSNGPRSGPGKQRLWTGEIRRGIGPATSTSTPQSGNHSENKIG